MLGMSLGAPVGYIAPGSPATPSRARAPAGARLDTVMPALRAAAEATGVDFSALFHTARLESGFNPSARASTSSATGLFQFIDQTWLAALAKHGPEHGIRAESRAEALALRRDPRVSALMAAEHMADNAETLATGLGRDASSVDLYLAHFLGAGGALAFLRARDANPGAAAAALMPAAARANRSIFFDSGQPRSIGDVHRLLAERFAGRQGSQPLEAGDMDVPARLQDNGTDVPPNTEPALQDPARIRNAAHIAYLLLAELGA